LLKGNLFIADTNNCVIRKVAIATNIITTFAGKNVNGFSGDGGLATNALTSYVQGIILDPQQVNIYFCDWSNNRIRKINLLNNIINTLAGTGSSTYKH
jgi:hypothetical protein